MTEQIRQACNLTHDLLAGDNYREANYQRVLLHYLQLEGFRVSSEEVCVYQFGRCYAGSGRIDIVAWKGKEEYILELKVGGHFKIPDYMAQLRKYVKHRQATLGILVIFDSNKKPLIRQYGKLP